MRDLEVQRFALECLRIADGDIPRAGKMLAFITGEDGESDGGSRPSSEANEFFGDAHPRRTRVIHTPDPLRRDPP